MLEGCCLCGETRWTFQGSPDRVTACNCTACRRYGALWAYGWAGEGIETSGATTEYQRGDPDLGFHFCTTCGCLVWYKATAPHADGRSRVAVNMRQCKTPDDIARLPIRHFDGLKTFKEADKAPACVADLWF